VQQGLIYACLIGNLLHAGTVDAAPDEDLVGGIKDASLGVGGGLPRRFDHLVSKAMALPASKSAISLSFYESSPWCLQGTSVSG